MSDRPAAGTSPRRIERVFIMRLWREPSNVSLGAMRGSVVEVDGPRFFFSNLGDLNEFLALRLAAETD